MNTGELIRKLRLDNGLTQKQLAEKLCVSDKAVSKWENNKGIPDVIILSALSDILHTDMQTILNGNLNTNESENGNMNRLKFYVCPDCGNIITSTSDAVVSCCGKKLEQLRMRKADENEMLSAVYDGGEWYVTTNHPMTKEHYISFVAYLNDWTSAVYRQYPEWQIQLHMPFQPMGRLVWYCNECGLLYMDLKIKR